MKKRYTKQQNAIREIYKKDSTGLLSREEAAVYLGVKTNTLSVWATKKRYGLKYIKVGRLVKYRVSDLDDFIHLRTITEQTL